MTGKVREYCYRRPVGTLIITGILEAVCVIFIESSSVFFLLSLFNIFTSIISWLIYPGIPGNVDTFNILNTDRSNLVTISVP